MSTQRRANLAILVWLGLVTLAPRTCAFQAEITEALTDRPAPTGLPRGFFQRTLEWQGEAPRKYPIYVPPQYYLDNEHTWPLIVSLHGSPDVGTDGVSHMQLGLPLYIAGRPKRFPFLAVFPQAQTMWFRGKEEIAVFAIIEDVCKNYRVDIDRIYLTGFSMGGFGAWEMGVRRPDLFAAIVPICGGAPLDFLQNLVNTPIWAFHGAKDTNVPVNATRQAIARLQSLGGSPQFTEFPQLEHNAWDSAYASPALYRWLLQQRRQTAPRSIDYTFPGGAARAWWLGIEAEPDLRSPAHIRVNVADGGEVNVEAEGVAAFAILCEREPIATGSDIIVKLNGAVAFKGRYEPPLLIRRGSPEAVPPPPTAP
jgi:poly(3-hydroxybutyrate) depolymerase